jgi:hypothetical protein
MAEKKKPAAKKKNPRFGGKRDLKDISGNQKIGFEDTFLGDLLGFDGKMGTKGKPGLLASLKGARRKKPGTATTTKKKPAVKKKIVTPKKPAATSPVRRGDGTGAGTRTRAKIPEGRKINMTVPPKKPSPTGTGPDRGPRPNPNARPSKPLPRKIFTPNEVKKNMKKITKKDWDKLTRQQRKNMGLPQSLIERVRLGNPPWKATESGTRPPRERPGR